MNQDTVDSKGGILAGLITDLAQGERALADLKSAGFGRVELSSLAFQGGASGAGDATSAAAPFFREHDSSASSFVREVEDLGFSKGDAHDLVEGVVDGDSLVTVDAGAKTDEAVAILERYHADVRFAALLEESAAAAARPPTADDERRIQLRAERLTVNKQRVRHAEVRVRKVVVDDVRSIDVPVRREELVIERHAAAGGAVATSEPIADETIRIPLREERVNVSKQTVVREEVEIGKRRVDETQHVSDTVRHEELRVDTSVRERAEGV